MAKEEELSKMTNILQEEKYIVIPYGTMICGDCGKVKSVARGNFYASNSQLHKAFKVKYKDKGKEKSQCFAPICKKCLLKNYDYNSIKKTINALHQLDKPFLPEVWANTIEGEGRDSSSLGKFGLYIKNISLNYKELTFFDGELELVNEKIQESVENQPKVKLTKKELEKAGYFWGKNKPTEVYIYLQNEMVKLQSNFECNDYGMEMILKDICWTNYEIEERRKKGEDVTKLIKSRQDLMNDGNLKPIQASGANATDQMTYGLFVKKLEEERPSREPDPEWADVDGLKKVVRVWFLGHMCHLMGIQNRLSKEYLDEYNNEIEKYTVEKEEIEEVEVDIEEDSFEGEE